MYFIGDDNARGTFFWWTKLKCGWVVADLDTGKARLYNSLATILVKNELALNTLEKKCGLGQDEKKWLIDGDELIPLLRDHQEDIEVLMIYYQDGSEKPYGAKEQEAAKMIREFRKKNQEEAKNRKKKKNGYE